ncbi:glycosyl hydrolases family 31-domain-containing protein [Stachybotrys elegans]|uniref:Glycosyl hydrolases family 31-domain-containing protein n=1 Tax=Stachybotrys elegans TaxID=80388 RepID=A0A8K0WQZ9_9HYPO|nr:glycosyl hydrolases family 31-domain-containing protein [Stachybotrys elegans]
MRLGPSILAGAAALFALVAALDAEMTDLIAEAGGALGACEGYQVTSVNKGKWSLEANLDMIGSGCGVYGPDIPKLKLLVEYQTDSRLHVVIQDREGLRYQVPEEIFPRPQSPPPDSDADSLLSFTYKTNPFSFRVLRKDTGEVLFDTSGTTLVFERQYLRLKTWLPPNPNLYGLGEHTDPFRLFNKNYVRTFWARDSGAVPYRTNLYGSHPIYFEHRQTGTHGVLLLSSNGMDVKIDQDGSGLHYLEYNIIGGIFDFYFLAGPGPIDVAKQYAELAGTPALVPYWSLGFQQCRFGYQDWFHVAEVAYNYSVAGIPLEVVWSDIDYMDFRRTFSLDPKRFPISCMQKLTKYLHDRQQRYIMMVDPAIAEYDYRPYNRGIEMGVFVKNSSSLPFRGVVWPGVTVWPDWFHKNTSAYWTERFHEMFSPKSGVDIDGAWIDMNEPASFCSYPCVDPDGDAKRQGMPPRPPPERQPPRKIPGFPENVDEDEEDQITLGSLTPYDPEADSLFNTDKKYKIDHTGDDLLSPPYKIRNRSPSGALSHRTINTDLQHANGLWHYDMHNIYGTTMSLYTRNALLSRRPGQRPFVVTRSTFAGAGRYVAKWLGDNVSRWDHYRASIAGMLNFASVFQVPMVGSDVCGFLGNTNEKLCARWATLGAFMPFYRNHADLGTRPQEFYQWPLVTSAAKYAISVRYRLLDYFYTAMYKQSIDGTPAINPMWYLYPHDKQAPGVGLQYFFGDCVLVSPVADADSKDVSIYLPEDVFYEFETQKRVQGNAEWQRLTGVPFDRIPLHVRGGCIVPLRTESANTTTELRKKNFELFVAPGVDGTAQGSLYLDDGISLDGGPMKAHVEWEYSNGKLKTSAVDGMVGLAEMGFEVEKVTVLGGESGGWDSDEL